MMAFGFGGFGMLFGFLFWIAIAGLIVWAISQMLARTSTAPRDGRYSSPPTQNDFALEILKQRFVRGEISREEFEAMRQDLAV